jgi:hypothetical protein
MQSHRESINFMENMPQTATLKDADTGKYTFDNTASQEKHGDLFSRNLLGLTVRDKVVSGGLHQTSSLIKQRGAPCEN